MKKTHWVVVADEAIARILERPLGGKSLSSVEELTDPAAHASGSDLRRDARGRRAGSSTATSRPGAVHRLRSAGNITASAGQGEQHAEAAAFARRVAERLDDALRQRQFEELQIVAAPRFLGLLRKAIGDKVSKVVVESIDKDWIHLSNDDIQDRLVSGEVSLK